MKRLTSEVRSVSLPSRGWGTLKRFSYSKCDDLECSLSVYLFEILPICMVEMLNESAWSRTRKFCLSLNEQSNNFWSSKKVRELSSLVFLLCLSYWSVRFHS